MQINQSVNYSKNTFRGFHFQSSPYQEAKLIRCISGEVLDIIIDLRKDSQTYLEFFSVTLNDKNKRMIFVPKGFAHGFITLQENTQLIYHHTEFYKPEYEDGINFKDPILKFEMKHFVEVISEKDNNIPFKEACFKGI